ncbi:MAG TPA: hypothetical protein VFG23_17165 [Polyangia bacterium]|nr:hypothetical protein [Polyangia bacterium]
MAALCNTRHEAFARALARGVSLREATAASGLKYFPKRMQARAATAAVVARVEELKEEARWRGQQDLKRVFEKLFDLASSASELKTGAALTAARGLLAEAARLREHLPGAGHGAPLQGVRPAPDLTKEEWLAAFAPRRS